MSRDFNFFEKYNKSRYKARKRIELLALLAAFVLFACFSGVVVSYALRLQMQAVQYEIDAHTMFLNSPGTIERVAKNEELNLRLSEIKTYNSAAAELNGAINNAAAINTYLMESITENITEGTSLLSMTVTSAGIEIVGISESEAAIAQFEHNMSVLRYVDSVFIASIAIGEGDGDISFVMSVRMKEVATGESIGSE